jgi:hypothetical protein
MGLLTNANQLASAHCWLLLTYALLILRAPPASGQSPPQAALRTTTVHWDRVPLRDALARLSMTLGEPIFTDRRVDPEQRISLDVTNATSDVALDQIATAAGLGVSRMGRLIYFGPSAAAARLRTLAAIGDDEIRTLPAEHRSALKRKQSFHWPRLAEPRQLVSKLVEERGLRLIGAEQIPHDLWPAGSLPELSLAEQLTVLLVGFDLTFEFESQSGTIELVPIAGPITITRRYRLPSVLTRDRVMQEMSGIDLQFSGSDVVVIGTAEDHERIANLLRPQREPARVPPQPARTRKLYTLRIEEQPLRGVLEQLGERLGWTIETDDAAIRAAGKSLDERVTFSVENVDEDALLQALLRPAGLDHERDGNRVRIFPIGKGGE